MRVGAEYAARVGGSRSPEGGPLSNERVFVYLFVCIDRLRESSSEVTRERMRNHVHKCQARVHSR